MAASIKLESLVIKWNQFARFRSVTHTYQEEESG